MLVVKKYKDGWYRGIRCRGYQVLHGVAQESQESNKSFVK